MEIIIKLSTGKEIKLTPEELRELYGAVNNIPLPWPNYPPYPNYPYAPIISWTTACGRTVSGG